MKIQYATLPLRTGQYTIDNITITTHTIDLFLHIYEEGKEVELGQVFNTRSRTIYIFLGGATATSNSYNTDNTNKYKDFQRNHLGRFLLVK